MQFAFSKTLGLESTLGHCTFIPENNKTTCLTVKIALNKLETAFPRGSASNFFFCRELFNPAFYTFLKYGFLSLVVSQLILNGKLNPCLSWVFESSSLDSFTANKIVLSRVVNFHTRCTFRQKQKRNRPNRDKNNQNDFLISCGL